MTAPARRPTDSVTAAVLRGAIAGAFVPAGLLLIAPSFRTPRGVLWLCVAGGMFGVAEYFGRRAAAWLRDEPTDLLRAYRVLNPDRYEPAGRPFAVQRIFAMVAFAVWWLTGALVLG